MNVVLDDFLIFLVSLFAISSPLVTVPIFISLTRGLAPAERRRIPRRTATGAFITFSVAYFVGEGLLRFLSVDIASLRIAGGLLILGMAWSMLHARAVEATQSPAEAKEAETSDHIAIVPLAIPLTAGPGAISLMIIAAGATSGPIDDAVAIFAAFLVSVSVFLVLRSAERIASVLAQTGMNVATRLMGLILAALAVEVITSGLAEKFPGLLR